MHDVIFWSFLTIVGWFVTGLITIVVSTIDNTIQQNWPFALREVKMYWWRILLCGTLGLIILVIVMGKDFIGWIKKGVS